MIDFEMSEWSEDDNEPDEMDKAKILNIEKQGRKILIQIESEENYCYISMTKHQAQKLADLLIG